jgi:hypothetical protein
MATQSSQIKQSLADDLVEQSDLIKYVLPYSVLPDTLDERDGFRDHAVCIYEGTRRPNVNVSATVPRETLQQYAIMVYARSRRLKGSEGEFEGFFDALSDEVYDWIVGLAENNRIHTVTSGHLRVPNRADRLTDFFDNKQEEVTLQKHTYAIYYIQTIRKS